jgi:DNA-binding NarL/FixJ family response regulator
MHSFRTSHGTPFMTKKLRIAYVEDHKIVQEGVRYLLSQYEDFDIQLFDLSTENLNSFITAHRTDVLILDLQLATPQKKKKMNGFEHCTIAHVRFPDLKILAHTMYDDIGNVNKFFKCGGMAFVSKKSGHIELVNAIRSVRDGKIFICNEIVSKAKNPAAFLSGADQALKASHELFTKTEKLVLEKIAKGFSTKQIAQQMEVSEKTVETHRKHLFEKADVKNVAELIAFAYSRKLFME